MKKNLRVRGAPSPTSSDIHAGNARTFLYNYIIARQTGGTFVLRMEDSDQSRSKDEYADNIYQTLLAIGLPPDEGYGTNNQPHGIYQQSRKMSRYREIADKLIQDGFAYRCYCTQEELDAKRKVAQEKDPKNPFKYDGHCRHREDHSDDKPYVIRFKAPTEGETTFVDKVFGKLTFPHKENYDFVLMRSDGSILYNFGCVVDDMDQKIDLVVRGRDHLANTVYQILLYNALGAPVPEFAHLPMMLNQKREKLSKRDCATSVSQYINELGFAPSAVLNYLAKFGFGVGDAEVFDFDFLIKEFNIEKCKKSDGCFDMVKFEKINYEHLKSEKLVSSTEYVRLLQPFLKRKDIEITDDQLAGYIPVVRSRAKTFVEAANLLEPMLKQQFNPDSALVSSSLAPHFSSLEEMEQVLSRINTWNESDIRSCVQEWLKSKGLSLKDIGSCLRVALLGQTNSPEIFQVLAAMGKEKSLGRIKASLSKVNIS